MSRSARQDGFSITELLVSMTVLLIVIAGAAAAQEEICKRIQSQLGNEPMKMVAFLDAANCLGEDNDAEAVTKAVRAALRKKQPEEALRQVADYVHAAAFPLTLLTAWHMLMTRARLNRGDDVLVLAAGSGVGQAAIQIASLYGARVFATAGSAGKLERARALGSYIRIDPYIGRRIDTTFTGGQYFESVIPVYLAPELMPHLRVA